MYGMPEKTTLSFRHLYDDRFAAFAKARYPWELPRIIFPSGFQPETGRDYKCIVTKIKKGEFVFEDISYHICHAMLEEEGNILDFMDFKYRGPGLKAGDGAKFGDLLVGIQLTLPEKHELLNLRVQSDRKNGGWQFVPKYSETDEDAGGKPSMRIFKPLGKKVTLEPYRTYKVRQESVRNTGRLNARGCIILEVGVTVL
ncbi:MAG: hypothetical protein WC726_00650 [Parcubacteria group bacterium]|jgi:hypothetical protein